MTVDDYEEIYNEADRIFKKTAKKSNYGHRYSHMRWNNIYDRLVVERQIKERRERRKFLRETKGDGK